VKTAHRRKYRRVQVTLVGGEINSLSAGSPSRWLRFYAAAPIVTHDGYRLGTVNVIDVEPRQLTAEQADVLRRLADLVMDHLDLRLRSLKALRRNAPCGW
jgi:GAF domain-containing protein